MTITSLQVKADLSSEEKFETCEKRQHRSKKFYAALAVAGLLLLGCVATMVSWTLLQPCNPPWLAPKTIIRAVTYSVNRNTSGNVSTVTGSASVEAMPTVSLVLHANNHIVVLAIIPGAVSFIGGNDSKPNTNSFTTESLLTFPLVRVTGNVKTGDIISVEAPTGIDSAFVNTALIVVQQMFIDTAAIVQYSNNDFNAQRWKRDVGHAEVGDKHCDQTQFGDQVYCKTAMRVDRDVDGHKLYRKTFTTATVAGRQKRDTYANSDDGDRHAVNVIVDSHVSSTTGLLEKGSVEAAAEIATFDSTDGSESGSGGQKMQFSSLFDSEFSVETSNENDALYQTVAAALEQVEMVEVDFTWASSKKREKRDTERVHTLKLFSIMGTAVSVSSNVRTACCSASVGFKLVVGGLKLNAGEKTISCGTGNYETTIPVVPERAGTFLGAIATPIGVINIHLTANFSSTVHASSVFSPGSTPTTINSTVRPQARASLTSSAGLNVVLGEVGAAVSVDASLQIPCVASFGQNCTASTSASIQYSASGKTGVYYKFTNFEMKCWEVAFLKICLPWPSLGSPKYIISETLSANGSKILW